MVWAILKTLFSLFSQQLKHIRSSVRKTSHLIIHCLCLREPSLPLSPSNFDDALQLISRRWNLVCRPTFAGLQSPSGFVFYTYKAQPRKIWLSACGWNKTTRVVDFSSVAGFSTSFATLEAFCIDRRSLASDRLLLALCFTHIKLSRRRHRCRRVARTSKTTRVVDCSSVAGFSTSFATLGAFVSTHICWPPISFWLCVLHI